MDRYHTLANDRTGLKYPKINVCETNTHAESNRPQFFTNVARWLFNSGGRRMLTFYKAGGPSGGAWDRKIKSQSTPSERLTCATAEMIAPEG